MSFPQKKKERKKRNYIAVLSKLSKQFVCVSQTAQRNTGSKSVNSGAGLHLKVDKTCHNLRTANWNNDANHRVKNDSLN